MNFNFFLGKIHYNLDIKTRLFQYINKMDQEDFIYEAEDIKEEDRILPLLTSNQEMLLEKINDPIQKTNLFLSMLGTLQLDDEDNSSEEIYELLKEEKVEKLSWTIKEKCRKNYSNLFNKLNTTSLLEFLYK